MAIYGDGPLKDTLDRQIKDLDLQGSVILKGNVSNLQEEIYSASLFVLSSDYEGMPNALLEAMALGLPVVSTRASGGGPETIIRNGENGVLVEANNKVQMAEAIKSVIANDDFSNRIALNASKISEKYSPKATLRAWKDFLEKV